MRKITLAITAVLVFFSMYLYIESTSVKKSVIEDYSNVEIISLNKPESLEGVEMVTYRSEFGYAVTFPKAWMQKNVTNAYYQPALEVVSIIPKDIDDPYFHDALVTIIIQPRTLEDFQITKDVVVGDWNQFEPTVLNGIPAFKKKLREPGAYYIFEHAGKLFRIDFQYDKLMGISEQEALWVLSTFSLD